jgi:putative phosphoserine phosphatase/1-acylglycerol-3-phosphate O-acyltransferase
MDLIISSKNNSEHGGRIEVNKIDDMCGNINNSFKITGEIDEIMNNEDFKKDLCNIAIKHNIPNIQEKAKHYLGNIFSEQDKFNIGLFVNGFKLLIDHGFYNKIDIKSSEIKSLHDLMKKKSIAFVSSHKSYLDLIIILIIMKKYELPLPFIFSGDNLNLPIIGDVCKKSGIIFIKRNSNDDHLYKFVLKYFIKWLQTKKKHFIWSIEGGRSRTGKISYPKLGILKYISEVEEITYVPVSIMYDLIPDLDDMFMEGYGKEKKGENLNYALNYFKRISSFTRGKISVRFGEPIVKNPEISTLALQIVREINNITPITTVSLICNALLNIMPISIDNLKYMVSEMTNMFENKEYLLIDHNTYIGSSVDRCLNLLLKEDIIIQQDNKYIINFYKYYHAIYYANTSVHHFYNRAFSEIASLKIDTFWDEISTLEHFFGSNFTKGKSEEKNRYILNKNIFNGSILVSPFVLGSLLESYKIVSKALLKIDIHENIEEKDFIKYCVFLTQELYWMGKIKKMETSASYFIQNVIPHIKNLNIWPGKNTKIENIKSFDHEINRIKRKISRIAEINEKKKYKNFTLKVSPTLLTQNILNGEKGSHIGAFFDLDRTIIRGFSAWHLVKNRILNGKITTQEILSRFFCIIEYLNQNKNIADFIATSARGIEGIQEKEFIELGNICARDIEIYDESRELIAAHMSMGHTVTIVSGASQYQVIPIAEQLNIKIIECTRLNVVNGRFTGELDYCCYGTNKSIAGKRLAEKYNLDLSKSYFYTDSIDDLPLLEIVGNPSPVNPDLKLIKISSEKGWEIKNFKDDNFSEIVKVARMSMIYITGIPNVLTGYCEGGIDKALLSLADTVTSISGVVLNVTGKENLWKVRPGVFIANHQSSMDMIVGIKLMERKSTALVKKELRNYPIVGQLLEMVGAIFVDTANKNVNIKEKLAPAVAGLKSGTSLIVFPEGTRSYDPTLGSFKKGAFHIAMQANVPIIPIIIKNSHDIMPRGTYTINSGIIDIKVLKPILTNDWNLENMDGKIDDIRNLYLKELGQQ